MERETLQRGAGGGYGLSGAETGGCDPENFFAQYFSFCAEIKIYEFLTFM